MKRKVKGKLLAILMSLAMAFTMMPMMTGKAYAAEEYNVYELTEEFLPGNKYVITIANTGEADTLAWENNVIVGSKVTIENGKIRNPKETQVFSAIGSGTTVSNLSIKNRYLIGATDEYGNLLDLTTAPATDRSWIYSGKKLKNTDNSKDYYVYHDGRTFYATTSSTDATTVYLFKEVPYVEYTVTFKVENGKWSDGTNESKEIKLAGPKGTELKLSADQIPGVGDDPDTHYKAAGSWDATPDTATTIAEDTTYTYTYEYADHVWGDPSYTWTEDDSKATALRTCSMCEETEDETVDTAKQEITLPTCTENGENKLTATFTNDAFSAQEKTVEVGPLGHKYGAWTKLDANQHQRVCEHDKSHVEKENHKWDSGKVTKKATTTATGVKTFTCNVCKGTKTETIPKLAKKANPLTIKAKTATVKYNKLKKKNQTLAVGKVIAFTKKGQGKMTYTKASGNKKITIAKTTGKVTVKKGLKKGTYKVKTKVKAAGNANYKASAWKTVTFRVKVK